MLYEQLIIVIFSADVLIVLEDAYYLHWNNTCRNQMNEYVKIKVNQELMQPLARYYYWRDELVPFSS